MSDCTHDCSSCGESCAQRESKPEDFLVKLSKGSSVKKVIGVVSGKGGVGKSMVTSLLAAASMREGFKTAILDGDITGPSIPKAFGLSMNLVGNAEGLILPATTTCGIDIVSVNLMLANETDPVIWRGPVLGGVIKQFWGETLWQNIDYMFIDMPPGTGDVPLTIFQSVRWYCYRIFSTGISWNDRRKSGEHGKNDECSNSWFSREYELCRVS